MILLYLVLIFFLFESSLGDDLASSAEHTEPNEPLFLDILTAHVLNETEDLKLFESWASRYVAAIQEKRFGDALWARYHIFGEVVNGTFGDTDVTVLGRFEEDTMEHKVNVPEDFSHALSLYANTSSNDTHIKVLDLLADVNIKEATHLKERVTFGYMSTSRSFIGMGKRAVFSYGNCYLRSLSSLKETAHDLAAIINSKPQDGRRLTAVTARNSNGRGGEWAETVRLLPAFPATCTKLSGSNLTPQHVLLPSISLHLEAIPGPKTMADLSSLAVSIAGLISLADVTFKYTYKFVKAVKDVKTNVSTLADETNNIGSVLRVLEALASDLEAEGDQFDPTLRNHYLNHYFETLRRIEMKTKKATERFLWSKAESIYQHLKWSFSSSETNNLLDELSRHKETITMALAAESMQKLQLSLTKIDKLGESISAVERIVKRIEINNLIDVNAHKKRILNYFVKVDPFWHKIELGGT
ncbi:hypothetical protein FLAG1_05771 [Fusarium langsethiae]|uniref:Azaphilone pigments biosynthesis cluster protein L N-terminal domain-containing protein n=1 Tax=Fusarium langsethiae TaxID=179993 RepID=A0A0M9EWZ3_FUSLA|nr:hypothetical protein FLAG1_05771 [Fusarium langsethiae]GKU03691.1 unnamed protein product [Fusarium langsethiae]